MMKRMLVFLLAALLLCGVAMAMADTTAETTRKTVSPRIDAVTAIQNECGKSAFDGYRLYGMLEKANVKSLIGVAEDGSVHLWTVRYDEDLPSPEVSGSELRLFAGRSDFELSTQVAPRYSNVDIQNMNFYDAHEVQLETGITYADTDVRGNVFTAVCDIAGRIISGTDAAGACHDKECRRFHL